MLKRILIVAALAIFAVTTATASASGGLPPSGKIWFGQNYARNKSGDLVIINKQSTFSVKRQIAWVAHFDQSANAHEIAIVLYYEQNGKDVQKWKGTTRLKHANSNEFANKTPARNFVTLGATKVGTYKLAYVHSGHLLASGLFTLTK